jgi:hypothetical protein
MKKPETYEKLLQLVHPKDLDEIFSFSGRNDRVGLPHHDLRREYSTLIWKSMKHGSSEIEDWRNPSNLNVELTELFYLTLIRCLQDFYWWSHGFSHIYASVYQRVVNVLEISMEQEELDKHYKTDKETEH